MALTEAQIIKYVRSKTTSDTALLPDNDILYFAGELDSDTTYQDNVHEGALDLNGVLADCWEYIARADLYGAEGQGNVSASQPKAERKAQYYFDRSLKAGSKMIVSIVGRSDLTAATVAVGGEHGA